MRTARHLIWTSASGSHVGMVRTVNEDSYLELPEGGLWSVADGMGGHQAGDVASQIVIDALCQIIPASSLEDFIARAEECLSKANRRIREESTQHYNNRVIGSTVVILLIYEVHGACLWVGDCRLYRLRNGQLRQLTRDHSYVQELIDRGLLKAGQADGHPMANAITRAVGVQEKLDIDTLTFSLQADDVFLLCSDGLNKAVTDDEIAGLLAGSNRRETVQELIDLALARGANDNVTAMVVKIEDGRKSPA